MPQSKVSKPTWAEEGIAGKLEGEKLEPKQGKGIVHEVGHVM